MDADTKHSASSAIENTPKDATPNVLSTLPEPSSSGGGAKAADKAASAHPGGGIQKGLGFNKLSSKLGSPHKLLHRSKKDKMSGNGNKAKHKDPKTKTSADAVSIAEPSSAGVIAGY